MSAPLQVQPLPRDRAITVARGIIAEAEAHDGASPVSDQAMLAVGQSQRALLLFRDPEAAQGAVISAADERSIVAAGIVGQGEVDLVVRPTARGRGIGTRALRSLLAHAAQAAADELHGDASAPSELLAWSHGDNPAADAMLERAGFSPARSLYRMALDPALLPDDAIDPLDFAAPEGLVLRAFDPASETDAEAWVSANAAAFATHPEQGKMTVSDLRALQDEPWFDAADLLLLEDVATRQLAGSTWVKTVRADNGDIECELYAVGVRPEYAGRGLGRFLLDATLARMAQHAPNRVTLYVDGENERAVTLYVHASFTIDSRSRQWSRPIGDEGRCHNGSMSEETPEVAAAVPELPADRYVDRELSWLAFNQRVLELAEDPSVPLLERANFLAIFASNLDEFFMVRVAGLKRRIVTGLAVPTNVGRAPADVLADINRTAYELQQRHSRCFLEQVKPALAEAGIRIVDWDQLDDADHAHLTDYYEQHIYPVLMPLAVDPAHPFPYISGRALNISIRVHNPQTDKVEFARLKVPQMIPRYVRVDSRESVDDVRYIPLEALIANQLDGLFPGMEVIDHHVFRVTRNEDMEIEEDETENLIQALEKELLRRRFGPPIRLEISDDMDEATLELLAREFDIDPEQVYTLPSPLDLSGLFALSGLPRPDLRFTPHIPVTHAKFRTSSPSEKPDIFGAIARREALVHHPYESFSTSVQAFVEQAATDPDVLAIKQTLYRTSGDSPIVAALIKAAEAGKQVLALVEVKARFDEEANITWARKLEQAGVHVVYGIVGLKTHCKLVQVIRNEGGRLAHYCHIGTGNYNPKTSRIYEDFGLFTSSPEVGRDVTKLFNVLSGYAIETDYDRLLVAPLQLRSGLLERIEREVEHARAGRPSGIRFKANSMVDEQIIDALYRASQQGVPVQVWVRGICSIRAGVPGLSDNIEVRSVLGRYLEHSRIYAFENGGDREVYVGSADLMHRNLDRRIEVLVGLTDREHLARIDRFFEFAFSDDVSSWRMLPDGTWHRDVIGADGNPLPDLQDLVMYDREESRARRAR